MAKKKNLVKSIDDKTLTIIRLHMQKRMDCLCNELYALRCGAAAFDDAADLAIIDKDAEYMEGQIAAISSMLNDLDDLTFAVMTIREFV